MVQAEQAKKKKSAINRAWGVESKSLVTKQHMPILHSIVNLCFLCKKKKMSENGIFQTYCNHCSPGNSPKSCTAELRCACFHACCQVPSHITAAVMLPHVGFTLRRIACTMALWDMECIQEFTLTGFVYSLQKKKESSCYVYLVWQLSKHIAL